MRNNYQINFNKIVTTVGLFVIETKTYHTNCKYFRYYFSLSTSGWIASGPQVSQVLWSSIDFMFPLMSKVEENLKDKHVLIKW